MSNHEITDHMNKRPTLRDEIEKIIRESGLNVDARVGMVNSGLSLIRCEELNTKQVTSLAQAIEERLAELRENEVHKDWVNMNDYIAKSLLTELGYVKLEDVGIDEGILYKILVKNLKISEYRGRHQIVNYGDVLHAISTAKGIIVKEKNGI